MCGGGGLLNLLLIYLGECTYLNGLSGGGLSLGLVGVGAHLVVDLLNGLSADSPGHGVALLLVDDILPGKLDGGALGGEGGGAHFGGLNNILDGAVVLGVLVAVRGGGMEVCGGLVVGGSVAVGRGGVVGGGGHGGGTFVLVYLGALPASP